MTGPQRELPPLLVRILGDNSNFKKSMEEVVSVAKDTAKQVVKSAKKQVDGSLAEFEREFHNFRLLEKSKELARTELLRRMRQLDKSYRKETAAEDAAAAKASAEAIKNAEAVKRAEYGKTVSFYRKGMRKINAEMQADGNKNYGRLTPLFAGAAKKGGPSSTGGMDLNGLVANAEKGAKERRKETERRNRQVDLAAQHEADSEDARAAKVAKVNNRIAGYFKKLNDGFVSSDRAALEKGVKTREAFWNTVQQGNKKALADHAKAAAAMEETTVNAAKRARSRASGSHNTSGDGMMGARADMFIHAGVLRNIGSTMADFIMPYAELERYTLQVQIFTRDAQKAKEVISQMQEYALVSPYSMNAVMESTSLLLKHGMAAKESMDLVKRLGDIAGGDSDKLRLLSLGVAQTYSMGKLRAQEKNQMLNAGMIHPLKVMAQHMTQGGTEEDMLKKMAELEVAMSRGRISAKMLIAAIEVLTNKGGNNAGAMDAQSKSVEGLASQIVESYRLIKAAATELFEKEIHHALKQVKELSGQFIDWMKANKALVAETVRLAFYVLTAAAAFSALAMTVATTRWVYGQIAMLFGNLWGLCRGLTVGIYAMAMKMKLLGGIARQSGNSMLAAWMKALGPLNLIIAAIVAAVGVLITLFAVANDNGFAGVFQNIYNGFQFLMGYFWNIRENISQTAAFISANWKLALYDMMMVTVKFVTNLGKMLYEFFVVTLPKGVQAGIDAIKSIMTGVSLKGDGWGTEGKDGKQAYDTSMLNLKVGGMGFGNMFSFLDPYKKVEQGLTIPPEKQYDFASMMLDPKAGKAGGHHKMMAAPQEHAVYKSAEHAQRMWQYDQAMMGASVVTADNAPQKQVALLEQIANNTRPDLSRTDSAEYADLDE